jgi:murein DD-endopeptidase MepM/ murein hydrolase activator NlpD
MFRSRFRAIARSLSLLTLLAATSLTTVHAEALQPRNDSVRLQRILSDDLSIDQDLVAHVASAPAESRSLSVQPVAAAPKPQTKVNATLPRAEQDEAEYQIASLGPAMRTLPLFSPRWPTRGLITTYYGELGPYSPRGHAGLDIANDTGTPILAADAGEVLKAYWNEDGYGGLIVIAHLSGYETWYGHLSRIGVEVGEHVDRGEQIGRMGSTGFSTGSHLHFEVRQEGELRDPLSFLAESALQPIGQ